MVITPNSCPKHHHAPATCIAPVLFKTKWSLRLPVHNSAYNLVSSSAAFIISFPSLPNLLFPPFCLEPQHLALHLSSSGSPLSSHQPQRPWESSAISETLLPSTLLVNNALAQPTLGCICTCWTSELPIALIGFCYSTVEVSLQIHSILDVAPRVARCSCGRSYRGLCQQPFLLPDCSWSQTDTCIMKNPPLSLSSRNFFDHCRSLQSPLLRIEVWLRQLAAKYQTNGSLQLYRPRPSPDAWSTCQRRIFPGTSQHFDQQSGDRYVSNPQTTCV